MARSGAGESSWHEPLTGLDATFLNLEDRTAHMHVGALAIFEGDPPRYETFARHILARLERVPRYRQRLVFVPGNIGRPAWVDESDFGLDYHVRHAALPAPGGDEELRKLAGRLFAQRLDRDKPLWELYLVEGLGGGRFAVLSKTHHCMVDGISGVDIATVMLDATAELTEPETPKPWTPRPAPGKLALVKSAAKAQLTSPLELLRGAVDPAAGSRTTLLEIAAGARPLLGLTQMGRAPSSSLNQPLGPHRRWEMLTLDLGTVKAVRAALGGTVNDVVLAVVAGAVRRLLVARGEVLAEELRVLVPVSIRTSSSSHGNHVTGIFCPLPLREADPVSRLRAVSRTMKDLKENRQAVGALALTRLSDFAPPTLAAQAARLQSHTPWFNLVVTNVPGPQFPLYLLGRKLASCHPLVPLAPRQTIGIALLSYDGALNVGILGDADRARDLPVLVTALREALDELGEVARAARATEAKAASAEA